MKEIKLTPFSKNICAIIDDCDYEDIIKHSWRSLYNKKTKSYYAYRNNKNKEGKTYTYGMHRHIMCCDYSDGIVVDHINHDTLDNRRSNLRVGTNIDNQRNRRTESRTQTVTAYPGIYKKNSTGKYVIIIREGKYTRYHGTFESIQDAINKLSEFYSARCPVGRE